MEEKKYFTPDLEDIRMGYTCEALLIGTGEWKKGSLYYQARYLGAKEYHRLNGFWTLGDKPPILIQDLENIRTPYLTKEQIENEGWRHSEKNCFDFNDRWSCSWYPEYTRMEFYDDENENSFAGECKDINTFRYICKLLKIKE